MVVKNSRGGRVPVNSIVGYNGWFTSCLRLRAPTISFYFLVSLYPAPIYQLPVPICYLLLYYGSHALCSITASTRDHR